MKIENIFITALLLVVVGTCGLYLHEASYGDQARLRATVLTEIQSRVKTPATVELVELVDLDPLFTGSFDSQNLFGAVVRTKFRGKISNGVVERINFD